MLVPDDVIEAARAVLPAWVGWLQTVSWCALMFVTAFVSGVLAQGIASRRFARSGDAHWTERARLRFPVVQIGSLSMLMAVAIAVTGMVLRSGPLTWPSARAAGVLAGIGAYVGAFFGAAVIIRRVLKPGVPWRLIVKSTVAYWVLFLTSVLVTLIAMAAMPVQFGRTSLVVLAVALAVSVWLVGGGCVRLLRWLSIVSPADDELVGRAARCAAAIGTSPPKVYELDVSFANAMALLVPGELIISRPLRELLPENELDAILAHEIGHLAEPRRIAWAHAARVCLVVPLAALPSLYVTYGWLAPLLLFVGIIGTLVATQSLLRRLEVRADAMAKEHEAEEGIYARALARMHEQELTPAVMPGDKNPHPHLYDRLVAAGIEPEYPRPEPPPKFMSFAGFLIASLLPLVSLIAFETVGEMARSRFWNRGEDGLLAIAMSGADPWLWKQVAWHRHEAGEDDQAYPLARLASFYAAQDGWITNDVADLYHEIGKPEEAVALLERHANEGLDEPWFAAVYAERWLDLDRADTANRYYGAATLLAESMEDYYLFGRLGLVAFRLGRMDEAAAYLARTEAWVESDEYTEPWLFVDLAFLNLDLGRDEAAASWFARARAAAELDGSLEDLEESIREGNERR